jgi:hypothetical protein
MTSPSHSQQKRIAAQKGETMSDWQPISTSPEGKVVLTKIDDECGPRNQQELVRQGRLWFFPDKSMYVYYDPTHWKVKP